MTEENPRGTMPQTGEDIAILEKAQVSYMGTIQRAKSVQNHKVKPVQEQWRERAYIAASRRTDRSLQARLQSACMASEIHKKRMGRPLRITEDIVRNDEAYEEEADRISATALIANAEWRETEINRLFAEAFPHTSTRRKAIQYDTTSIQSTSAGVMMGEQTAQTESAQGIHEGAVIVDLPMAIGFFNSSVLAEVPAESHIFQGVTFPAYTSCNRAHTTHRMNLSLRSSSLLAARAARKEIKRRENTVCHTKAMTAAMAPIATAQVTETEEWWEIFINSKIWPVWSR